MNVLNYYPEIRLCNSNYLKTRRSKHSHTRPQTSTAAMTLPMVDCKNPHTRKNRLTVCRKL